jgi:hypothetical protein
VCAGGGASDVDAGHGSGLGEDDSAAGGGTAVGPVADLDAGDVGDGVVELHGVRLQAAS